MDSFGNGSLAEINFLNSTEVLAKKKLKASNNSDAKGINTFINAAFNFDRNDSNVIEEKSGSNTWHGDEGLVYANLSEIAKRKELEDIDRRPCPPLPDSLAQPLRTIANGWQEYRTLGGRSYFFHAEKGIGQWKPPRSTANGRNVLIKSTICATSSHDHHCPPSTSFDSNSKELFAEIPLFRDYGRTAPESAAFQRSTFVESGDAGIEKKPNIMSHSLDGEVGKDRSGSNSDLVQQNNLGREDAHYDIPANQSQDMALRHGFLGKCKLTENGIKLKKRDWSTVYAYLYMGHLLFYKDQKAAEKTGKHYPTPIEVCDLRNAILSFAENEKHKERRRKHVISLLLLSKTEYLFSCNEDELDEWFHSLRQAITSSPPASFPINTIISDYCGSLQRTSLRHKREHSGSHFPGKSTLHNSIKSKFKSSSAVKAISEDHFSTTDSNVLEGSPPAKATIIERLLRFFRSRPTMESLRERGIYKPEPVFGSTLADICAREKSNVPKFITEITRHIEEKGIDSDGLYRVNGNLSSVQKIRCQIDQDCYDAMWREEDIHVLSGALKLFIRELQEPIFPLFMHKDFFSAMRESGQKRLKLIDDLLLRLPLFNKETLRVLITHLNKVAVNSGKNRMQVHNLAIIFGPSLFCSEDRPSHMRKTSQDKGKSNAKNKAMDKGGRSQEDSFMVSSYQIVEPTQNLAYRMVVYGQIIEYILNEAERLTIFKFS